MSEKQLGQPFARVGNAREYLSVHAPGGVVPKVDAVVLTAPLLWLKQKPLAVARLSAQDARRLAIDLLTAAEDLDARGDS